MKIAFAGTPAFAAQILEGMLASPHRVVAVISGPDRPAGRGRRLTPSPVKKLALKEGIAVQTPFPVSTPETVAFLRTAGAQVLVVAAYGQLLKAPLLGRLPCINVHASLLPAYRGAAPVERALMAGEAKTGVCIMQMEAGLDSGPVAALRELPLDEQVTAGELYPRLARLGVQALLEVLSDLEAGTAHFTPQKGQASYAAKITARDRLVSFDEPARVLHNKIRALSPHIGALAQLCGEEITLLRSRVLPSTTSGQPVGLPSAVPGGFAVSTAEGLLEVLELKPPGRRAMSAAEFLRGRPRFLA